MADHGRLNLAVSLEGCIHESNVLLSFSSLLRGVGCHQLQYRHRMIRIYETQRLWDVILMAVVETTREELKVKTVVLSH